MSNQQKLSPVERDLIRSAHAQIAENEHRPILLNMNIPTAMIVVGLVQLACRHPQLRPTMLAAGKQWVEHLKEYCMNEGWTDVARLIDAGWVDNSEPTKDGGQ